MNDQAINAITNEGCTVLHYAITHCKDVIFLLNKMNDQGINAITNKGVTALHLACAKGSVTVTIILLDMMNDQAINAITDDGYTALHYAIKNCIKEVVILILNKMNDQAINAITNKGETVLHLAYKGQLYKVVELLTEKMSPEAISILNKQNVSRPLYYATKAGLVSHVNSLVSKMTPDSLFKLNLNEIITLNIEDKKIKDLILNKILGAKIACNIYFGKELNENINQEIDFNNSLADICQNILKIKLINHGLYKYQDIAEYKQFIKTMYNQESSASLIDKITNEKNTGLLDILEEQIMIIESSLICEMEKISPIPYKLLEKYKNHNNSDEQIIKTINFYEKHPLYKIAGNYLREKLEQNIEAVRQALSSSESLIKSLEDLKLLLNMEKGNLNTKSMNLSEEPLNPPSEESLESSIEESDFDISILGEINND